MLPISIVFRKEARRGTLPVGDGKQIVRWKRHLAEMGRQNREMGSFPGEMGSLLRETGSSPGEMGSLPREMGRSPE
jgi:hypothetical protein